MAVGCKGDLWEQGMLVGCKGDLREQRMVVGAKQQCTKAMKERKALMN